MARRHERQPNTVYSYGLPFSPPDGGVRKFRLGGELCREEQRISRKGERADRDGTVDDMCEVVFRLPFPPSSGTTGVAHEHMSGRPVATRARR
jgi:hypothetical protein